MVLNVLIPKPGTSAEQTIDAGSGIVGDPNCCGNLLRVYYEGNRYRMGTLASYESKVRQAASRMFTQYPTLAMGTFPADEFEVVGQYIFTGPEGRLVIEPSDRLAEWIGYK